MSNLIDIKEIFDMRKEWKRKMLAEALATVVDDVLTPVTLRSPEVSPMVERCR